MDESRAESGGSGKFRANCGDANGLAVRDQDAMKPYCHPISDTCRVVAIFAGQDGNDLDNLLVDIEAGKHLEAGYNLNNPSCLIPVMAREAPGVQRFFRNT